MHSFKRVRAFQIELEFGSVGFFEEKGKTGVPGEKPLGASERTNNKLNHKWRGRRGLNPGHIGGRQVLSPLRHPCSPRKISGGSFSSTTA